MSATLSKCVNRAIGTVLAGALGVGVHWVASQSGDKFEPVILQFSVFLLAAAATFSRFIPSIKERFDYGTMIFILTFSLISVSGYRCVADYFRDDVKDNAKNDEASSKLLHGYKCVLNSKATEESLANLARWEPSHGSFSFGHPWKEYIKVGASLRSCAYCIEALNGSITSETKVPDFLKKHFSKFCLILSANSSAVLKELAITIATMTKSSKIDHTVKEMKIAVQELQNAVASLSKQPIGSTKPGNGIGKGNANPTGTAVTLVEIIPLVTVSSLLIDIAARIEKIVETVNGLAAKAEFRQENKDDKTMMTSPKV
ncbi:hypothetical protein CASFOL_023775 [Castilleja foliolosa]|uniref:Aluminum-activated malate transporter n=1 Tax=Castilleja foliolosa TaxID=1961234 RepID=A0ABD3CPE3_9LAMI